MLQMLKNFNELVVFKHSIFALPFILVAIFVANKLQNNELWFGFKILFLAIICAVSARNFAMAFNRYKDADIDKINPRCANRPSVDGRISTTSNLKFIAINGAIFVLATFFINSLAFKLSLPILAILAFYSYVKRFSVNCHLVLGFCDGISAIAGAVMILNDIPLWSVLLCFGVTFWVAGFDVLYSLQDIDFDKKNSLFSIPSIFGEQTSFYIASLFHAIAVLFWFLFVFSANLGFLAFLGVFVSGVILYFEHKIVKQDFNKIDRAFFTLNGYLSFVFFIFIIFDIWS